MVLCDSNSWFALRIIPRHEKKVETVLEYMGYVHFLPRCQTRRKWSDRIRYTDQPLFPGYIFCKGKAGFMDMVRSVSGIVYVVNFGGKPYPIPTQEIEALRCIDANTRAVCPAAYLKVGEKVQVISGPLEGIKGIITNFRNRARLVISLDCIMKSISVEIDRAEVTSIRANGSVGGEVEIAS
jgi:transcription antitermination factor NusG